MLKNKDFQEIFRQQCEETWGDPTELLGPYHAKSKDGRLELRWYDQFPTGTFTQRKSKVTGEVEPLEVVRASVWVAFVDGLAQIPQHSPRIAAKDAKAALRLKDKSSEFPINPFR